MRGMSEFIREHSKMLKEDRFDESFLSYHLTQIGFLKHERSAHLIVMLFVAFCSLTFLALFLFLNMLLFLVLFILMMILTVFYIFHYYKLENTLIEWYFIYNERIKKRTGQGKNPISEDRPC